MTTGISNLKEVLDLVFTTATMIIADIKKDGFQISDFYDFIQTPQFKQKFEKAVEDIQKIPAEVLDLKGFEFMELGGFLVKKIVILVKAIAGKGE